MLEKRCFVRDKKNFSQKHCDMMAESQNSGEGAAIARQRLGKLIPASTIPGSSLGNSLHSMSLNNGGILGSNGICA
jgi:hypothetical protein